VPGGRHRDDSEEITYPASWGFQLDQWRARKAKVKKETEGLSMRVLAIYIVFFILGSLVVMFFLVMTPQPPTEDEEAEDLANWQFYVNPFYKMESYGPYDILCFGALILENLLFVWALLESSWPTNSTQSSHRGGNYNEGGDISEENMLLNTEYDHEVALLIATHKCDSTHEKRRGLQKALEHALERFPASSIFVCDNARDEAPPDATWMLVADIVEDTNIQEQVHYVYLPVGNKTLAFFWTIDVWIPILEEAKMCPRFKYIMMIDDDVAVPARLQFPIRALNKEEDVQAYAYAINCFTNTKEQAKDAPMLVRYQNIEYLLAGFFKQFQSSYGTALACHGAISLWRRDILVSKILWDHDTIFNGEDLQMGLLLHSMKQGHKIGCSARHLVQTDPPDHLYMLWQQRVKSWDVTAHRKTVTFLKIALLHWCGGLPSLILKPFLFMELFNIIQDWARIFFFAYLLTYNEGRIHLLQWILYLFLLQVSSPGQKLHSFLFTALANPFLVSLYLQEVTGSQDGKKKSFDITLYNLMHVNRMHVNPCCLAVDFSVDFLYTNSEIS